MTAVRFNARLWIASHRVSLFVVWLVIGVLLQVIAHG